MCKNAHNQQKLLTASIFLHSTFHLSSTAPPPASHGYNRQSHWIPISTEMERVREIAVIANQWHISKTWLQLGLDCA